MQFRADVSEVGEGRGGLESHEGLGLQSWAAWRKIPVLLLAAVLPGKFPKLFVPSLSPLQSDSRNRAHTTV